MSYTFDLPQACTNSDALFSSIEEDIQVWQEWNFNQNGEYSNLEDLAIEFECPLGFGYILHHTDGPSFGYVIIILAEAPSPVALTEIYIVDNEWQSEIINEQEATRFYRAIDYFKEGNNEPWTPVI